MDPYYSCNNSDSFSSSSSPFQYRQASQNNVKPPPPPAHHSALHSVRKFPSKNAIAKKPLNAPLPPTRGPKVYKVDPVDFQDVVQRLTGAEEFRPTRMKEAPPPQLSLCPPPHPGFLAEEEDKDGNKPRESSFGAISSPLGFSLSPSSFAWCSSFLTSPNPL